MSKRGYKQETTILNSLLFAFYILIHPLDGLWDMKHEKRGTLAAANIIIGLVLLASVLRFQMTSFLFFNVPIAEINMIIVILGILVPIGLAVLANWGITTLFNGKGTFKDIYMGIGYSLTPVVLIQLPLIFISNLMTVEEYVFYYYLTIFSQLWAFALIIAALMMIHDYSLTKAVVTFVVTVIGMMVIIFVALLFFSVISEAIAYFISFFKELQYRFY